MPEPVQLPRGVRPVMRAAVDEGDVRRAGGLHEGDVGDLVPGLHRRLREELLGRVQPVDVVADGIGGPVMGGGAVDMPEAVDELVGELRNRGGGGCVASGAAGGCSGKNRQRKIIAGIRPVAGVRRGPEYPLACRVARRMERLSSSPRSRRLWPITRWQERLRSRNHRPLHEVEQTRPLVAGTEGFGPEPDSMR